MQVTIKYARPMIEGYTVHLSPSEAQEFLRVHDLNPYRYGAPLRTLLKALKEAGVEARV